MKKFFCIMLLVLLCLSMYSCIYKDSDYYDDEQFQRGIEYEREEMFLRIYNAVGQYNRKSLLSGDVWNTKHFSIIFTDEVIDGDKYLCFDLTLKTTTIGHCYEYGDMFFNIYAKSKTEGLVLPDDYFLDYGLFDYSGSTDEYLEGNTAKGSVQLLDNSNVQTIIIIIMIQGSVYTAVYNI